MLRTNKAVLAHIALGPVQVGVGKVDRHGLLDAAIGCVAGGSAGVGKQVEEAACLFGVLAHQAAGDAVIQEDAHIQIVVKVDGKVAPPPMSGRRRRAMLARSPEPPLPAPSACRTASRRANACGPWRARARPEHQEYAARWPRCRACGPGQARVDGLGCGVFGNDEPAARRLRAALVQVDGGGVVGQVGIVDAVAAYALALGPLAAQARVLAQAVGELLGPGDEHGSGLPSPKSSVAAGSGMEEAAVAHVRGLFLGVYAGRSSNAAAAWSSECQTSRAASSLLGMTAMERAGSAWSARAIRPSRVSAATGAAEFGARRS